MSIFNWLFSKPAASAVSSATHPVVPPKPVAAAANGGGTELQQLRQVRRDHLYSVVRDAMLRSEVLASHYKFKVLSLDTQGRQFLVMIDLLGDQSLSAGQLASIEALISSTAAQRYALIVKSVYWRQAEPAAVAASPLPAPAPAPAPQHGAGVAPPAPAMPVQDVAAPTPRGRGGAKSQGFEPIGTDEVLAFKKAIATTAPATVATAAGAAQVSGLRNAAAMSGFEDTQLMEPEDPVSPLSGTQFGDL